MRTVRDGFWILVLGLLVCFAFFLVLGAVSFEAGGLLVVMAVLAVLYLGHTVLNARRARERDIRYLHDRERRGF